MLHVNPEARAFQVENPQRIWCSPLTGSGFAIRALGLSEVLKGLPADLCAADFGIPADVACYVPLSERS